MRKIYFPIIPLLTVLFMLSCKSKRTVAQQGIVNYDKSIQPLETDKMNFKKYSYTMKEAVTNQYLQRKLAEVTALGARKDVRFVVDSAVDKESNYVSARNSADPSGIFEIDKRNGKIFYNVGLKGYKEDKATEGLPSEADAIKLTERLYRGMNLPDLNQLSQPVVSYLEMSVKNEKDPPQTFRKMITVRYDRVIDNLRVEGASRLSFNFGRNAELTTLLADWHSWDAADVSKDQVITAQDLQKQIEQTVAGGTTGLKRVLVTKREVVLYDDGHSTMEPAIYVQAICTYTARDTQGKESTYDIPRDFFQPILKQSTALFPAVKDRQVRIQPRGSSQQDTTKKANTRDE